MSLDIFLKKNDDFRGVYCKGRSAADKSMILYAKRNDMEFSRLGVSVSKKYGNSVERHRFKRRLKEVFRLNVDKLVPGNDLVVIARNEGKESSYSDLEASFLKLAARLHVTGENI